MSPTSLPSIAVIADAHFHDLFGDYGMVGLAADGREMALRPFANTVRSTRVFNESGSALKHALDDVSARGIRHVVLLGDYSDDGQKATMSGLFDLLEVYRRRHRLRFYATPGNHDIFGLTGRHRSKRFVNAAGDYNLVTSNPAHPRSPGDGGVIVSDSMHCAGYPLGLQSLGDVGYFRSADTLLWETPFGADDDPASRFYSVQSRDGSAVRRLMDASYLVEPFVGVWLLMIDANVFVPVDGTVDSDDDALIDSTDAGWNAMLVHKRFVLDWAKSVAARAEMLGKRLLAFSHYPALDPLDNTGDDERGVLGETSLRHRVPDAQVGKALIEAGIRVHFSGHLHINDTARMSNDTGFLVNVSVPSLVAFPCAYKIISVQPGRLEIETVSIGDMPLDDRITARYRAEIVRERIDGGGLLDATDYGSFLSEHLGHLVGRRHLRREWPQDLAEAVRQLDVFDLAACALISQPVAAGNLAAAAHAARTEPRMRQRLADLLAQSALDAQALSNISTMNFLGDWYRLRMGSDLGLVDVSRSRLAAYDFLSGLYAGRVAGGDGGAQASFGALFRMFARFKSGLPSADFTIDLANGDIAAMKRC